MRREQEGKRQEGKRQEAGGRAGARARVPRSARALGLVLLAAAGAAACERGPELDTRTFQVQYLPSYQVEQLIRPYVFTDRAENPGTMSVTEGAATIRETPDNLEKIQRVLAEYDRPKPTVMLTFQIIEADGASESDPAIAEVERELRRLFRFEGYDLIAETQVAAIQGTGIRQLVRPENARINFGIHTGVTEVRTSGEGTTLTLDVELGADGRGTILQTSVTIPAGHSVVLGTAQTAGFEGALILVVRAEVVESGM